jgi:hypothetical protein
MLLRFFLLSNRSNGALGIESEETSGQSNNTNIPLRDIKDSLEFKLSFDGEVFNSKMILPVVGK